MHVSKEKYSLEHLITFGLAVAATPTYRSLWVCAAMVGMGLIIRFLALASTQSVAPRGIYQWLQCPDLFGRFLILLGFIFCSREAMLGACAMLICAAWYRKDLFALKNSQIKLPYRVLISAAIPQAFPARVFWDEDIKTQRPKQVDYSFGYAYRSMRPFMLQSFLLFALYWLKTVSWPFAILSLKQFWLILWLVLFLIWVVFFISQLYELRTKTHV